MEFQYLSASDVDILASGARFIDGAISVVEESFSARCFYQKDTGVAQSLIYMFGERDCRLKRLSDVEPDLRVKNNSQAGLFDFTQSP